MQYQLASALVQHQGSGASLGWVTPETFRDVQVSNQAQRGFLVVKCHEYITEAAELLAQDQAKAIYVYRDVRDVVVSLMFKRQKSFWDVIEEGWVQRIVQECQLWHSCCNVLVSRYEDMYQDLAAEVRRIAQHLGLHIDRQTEQVIAAAHTREEQIRRIHDFDYQNRGKPSGRSMYDPVSLLHNDHIHSGEPGEWRTTLSRLQVAVVESLAGDWLNDKGYDTREGQASLTLARLAHTMAPTLRPLGASVHAAAGRAYRKLEGRLGNTKMLR